jgi:hypothetical protein
MRPIVHPPTGSDNCAGEVEGTTSIGRRSLRGDAWSRTPARRKPTPAQTGDPSPRMKGSLGSAQDRGHDLFSSCDRTRSPWRKWGICRFFRLEALGHERATKHTNHVWADNVACLFAGTSKYGSDGTRTRDLRRDRPVSPLPESPGLSGDSRPEQDLSSAVLRGLPGAGGSLRGPPAGWMRDAQLSRQRTSGITL